MNRRTAAFGLLTTLALAGCGASEAASPTRYEAGGTVLEGGGHGPQLCMMVMESSPPQCSGLDIAGWDWNKVDHESQGGVKWGEYHVVGTWDGTRLTLTEPPGAPAKAAAPAHEEDLTSPCPAPEGGWRPVDPAKATQRALDEAMARAGTAQEFAGAWLDQSYMKGLPAESPEASDPRRLVLNLKFTGDLSGREAWIREVWGGALCVSGAARSQSELEAIQRQVEAELGDRLVSASSSVRGNQVTAQVWVATDELRRDLEARHGAGAVVLDGVLRPAG
ncbi:hypothetical protein ACFPOI_07370 [Nonomuraea angiospora]|uniref:Lipoprotein n=1 Tax=Nonomuraea angiospora TaxID=46172 RepID=A0ABR9MD25_9ACTN|nr:hypothetical protein [Nonomuraea angiospora]MBE1590840.1 hypothetical protein [Nonomuraea angiospora]